MSEEMILEGATKEERYVELIPQLKELVVGETDSIANVANLMAALKETFGWLWVGVYFVKGEELVLGPFQGPVACTRIPSGKGVCGTAWLKKEILVIDDVDKFPEHIACSYLSRSEIVLPLVKEDMVVGVLDVDSADLGQFTSTDAKYLQEVVEIIESVI